MNEQLKLTSEKAVMLPFYPSVDQKNKELLDKYRAQGEELSGLLRDLNGGEEEGDEPDYALSDARSARKAQEETFRLAMEFDALHKEELISNALSQAAMAGIE